MANLFDTAPSAIQQNMIRDVQEMTRYEAGRSIDEREAVQLARKILARAKSRDALYHVTTDRLRRMVDELQGGGRQHATKKSHAQLDREIAEALANPASEPGSDFTPPQTLNVVDRHGGFTAVTRSGTLWRPGQVARGGTVGSLVPGSVKRDDFYQNNRPVVSALYKLPGYGYKIKIWWKPSGERIA